VLDCSLECYRTTSEHVPEHKQFTDIVHDIHAYTQRERQIERAICDVAKSQKEIFDLTTSLGHLYCKDSFGAKLGGACYVTRLS
jgi:hypothetical protein